jgi:ligand-binding sensor domain-containing protein
MMNIHKIEKNIKIFKFGFYIALILVISSCVPKDLKRENIQVKTTFNYVSINQTQTFTDPQSYVSNNGLTTYQRLNDVSVLKKDNNGDYWSGGRNGVIKWIPVEKVYQSFTSLDGLSTNHITALVIDHKDRVWIGTDNGKLAYYDGNKWSTINLDFGERITALVITSDDGLWIGTNSGLFYYSAEKTIHYTHEEGLLDNFIQSVHIASNGVVWVGVVNGVSSYDGSRWKNYRLKLGSLVNCISEGPDHVLWFGVDNILFSFQNDVWKEYKSNSVIGPINSITFDSTSNDPWLTTSSGGLIHFDLGQHQYIETNLSDLSEIISLGNNEFLMGSHTNGLYLYEKTGMSQIKQDDGLVDYLGTSLLVGKDGSVWIGTNQGMSKFNGKDWVSYTKETGLGNDAILSIQAQSNGLLWVQTEKGLSHYEQSSWMNQPRGQDRQNRFTSNMVISPDDSIWFLTYQGLIQSDGKTENIISIPFTFDLDWQPILRKVIFAAPDGSIWVGRENGKIYRYGDHNWSKYTLPVEDIISALLVTSEDDYWVGTSHSGVFHQRDGAWVQFNLNHTSKQDYYVHTIVEGKDGVIWIGTDHGLMYIKNNELILDNLKLVQISGMDIRAIGIDQNGRIWIATLLDGIFSMDDPIIN